MPAGAHQGLNVFGENAYGGPCPPPGPVHGYHVTLYAVNIPTLTGLGDGATFEQVTAALDGRVLAMSEIVGLSGKKRNNKKKRARERERESESERFKTK